MLKKIISIIILNIEENTKEPALQNDVAKDEILASQVIEIKILLAKFYQIDTEKPLKKKKEEKDQAHHKRKELHVATTAKGRRRKKIRPTSIIQQQTNNSMDSKTDSANRKGSWNS